MQYFIGVDSGGTFTDAVAADETRRFAVYDTERLHLTAAGHGIEVARSAGIFGGYPGSCNLNVVATPGAVLEIVERRRSLPYSLKDLGEELEFLEACTPSKWMGKDQVVYYRETGGGGYGDPLDRDPELVLADVVNERVSPGCARDIYGVALEPEALRVSRAETERLRSILRQSRLQSWEHQSAHPEGRVDAPSTLLGEYLEIARTGSGPIVRCARCGHTSCTAAQNPKKFAAMAEVPYSKARPWFPDQGKSRFFLREFYCPGCATRFEVEVTDRETPILHDIELSL